MSRTLAHPTRTVTPSAARTSVWSRVRRTGLLTLLVLGGLIGSAEAQTIVSATRVVQANAESHSTGELGAWRSGAGAGLTTASQNSNLSASSIVAQGAANAHWPSSNYSQSTVDVSFNLNFESAYTLTGDIYATVSGFAFTVPGSCSATLTGPNGVVASYVVEVGGPVFGYTLNSAGTLPPGTYTLSIKGEASGYGSSPMTGADGAATFNVSLNLAGPCGAPNAGPCATAHGTPGCSDVTCCDLVCAADPFCCSTAWDAICANEALATCAFPPTNDECASALPVGVGQTPVSNALATGVFVLPATCDEGYGLSVLADVYYRYVAEGTGLVTVSTCGAATFDTRLAVFTGGCATPNVIACNDDTRGCPDYTSSVSFPAVCGQEFTIVLGSFNGATGTATLTIDQQGYCNAECADAAEIPLGATAVSNVGGGATVVLPPGCDEGYGTQLSKAVYYRHLATATGALTISTCGGVSFDSRLAVFTGPCDDPQWLGCNDDACSFGGPAEVTIPVTCGTEYTIILGSYDGTSGSGFMTLTQQGSCGPVCPGDIDRSGSVDASDLAILLGQWATSGADLDGDGTTNAADLAILLGAWGPCV